jgi:hypothetical protein
VLLQIFERFDALAPPVVAARSQRRGALHDSM